MPGRLSSSLSLLLCCLAGAAAGAGHPPIKAGMPCVEELCVGDGAEQLARIQWQTAVVPDTDVPLTRSRVSDRTFERLGRTLRGEQGALLAIAPYWVARRFDVEGLKALAGLRAVCENPGVSGRLKGTYSSREGYRTVVGIEPVAAGGKLRFVVASIRQYVGEGAPRPKALGEEVAARYADFPRFANATEAAAAWVDRSPQGPYLRLLAPTGDTVQRDIDLRSHPDCRNAAPGEGPKPAPA